MQSTSFVEPKSQKGAFPATGIYLPFLVGLVLFLALAARLYRLSEPPMDFHPTRQYIGAIVARAYYFEGNTSLPESRRQIARTVKENQELLEPQILPFIAATAYRLSGGEHLWIPRLVSIICWFIGGGFLYAIARKLASRAAGVIALVFYLLVPFGVMASRVFQPDPMMLMLALGAIYLILRYDESLSVGGLLVAAIVAAAALLVKPVCVFVIFAAFVSLAVYRSGLMGGIVNLHFAFFVLISLSPTVAYYLHGAMSGGFIREQGSFTFVPHLFEQPAFWKGWLLMIGRVVGFIPLLIALIGTLIAPARFRVLLLGLWAGYFAYGLAFNYHIHTHDYYSLPLIPIVALGIGSACESVLAGFVSIWSRRRREMIALTVVLVIAAGATAVVAKTILWNQTNAATKSRLKAVGVLVGCDKKVLAFVTRKSSDATAEVKELQEIGELVGHSDKTIFLTEDFGKSLMYHGELCGASWPTTAVIRNAHRTGRGTLETAEDFESLARQRESEYFIATAVKDLDEQAQLKEYLTAKYPILAQTERYIIFRLAQK